MTSGDAGALCAVCGGRKQPGVTTYSVELGFGVVVVRNVPAEICSQCGEEWIADDVARQLEDIVNEAREKRRQVEILAM